MCMAGNLTKQAENKHFVQTDRKTHEAWAKLTLSKPSAAALMHVLASQVGEHNAVVASYGTLAELLGVSTMTIRRAVAALVEGNWLEVNRVGGSGSTNAYTLNDRVVWTQSRSGLRYSLFSANVIVSSSEQADEIENRAPLKKLPNMGEFQLPSGDGLPPPSQPFLKDMEPDLPTIGKNVSKQLDIEEFTGKRK